MVIDHEDALKYYRLLADAGLLSVGGAYDAIPAVWRLRFEDAMSEIQRDIASGFEREIAELEADNSKLTAANADLETELLGDE